jgi:hypothetical protein
MPPLAQRNLFHDKVRLMVTLTGIVFSVVLIVVQLGLFFGFTTATSNLIDHSGADLWITSKNVPYVEEGVAFSERKLNQVRAVPGVADAQKIIAHWTQWKRHDGGEDSVQIVGINVDDNLERPWNLVQGQVEDLKSPDAIILDELYKQKLGVTRVGEVFEIGGHRARVVGFTRGIRSFTTSPYVFTTFKNAQKLKAATADNNPLVTPRPASSRGRPADTAIANSQLSNRAEGLRTAYQRHARLAKANEMGRLGNEIFDGDMDSGSQVSESHQDKHFQQRALPEGTNI